MSFCADLITSLVPVLALIWMIFAFYKKRTDDLIAEDRLQRRSVYLEFLTANACLAMTFKDPKDEIYLNAYEIACSAADKVYIVAISGELQRKVADFKSLAEQLREVHKNGNQTLFSALQERWAELHISTRDQMRSELKDTKSITVVGTQI